MQRRIITLHDNFDQVGGGEQLLATVSGIAARHARVELGLIYPGVRAPAQRELPASSERVMEFEFPRAVRPRTVRAYLRELRRLSDWIHERKQTTCVTFSWGSAVRAAMSASTRTFPLVCVFQEDIPEFAPDLPGLKRMGALRLLGHVRARAVCLSEHARATLDGMGYPAELVHVIRPGVTPEHSSSNRPSTSARAEMRVARGIPRGDLVAVSVARIDPLKGHDVLLDAVAEAARRGVRVVLLCVGGVADAHLAHRAQLERQAQRLGIAAYVHWLGHRDDVQDWLALADVGVLASRSEAMPIALLEAAAVGLPLVGSRVGGVPEVVLPGQTGYLFEVGDADACAGALIELAGSARLRERLGAAARRHVHSRFDGVRNHDLWSDLLGSLA